MTIPHKTAIIPFLDALDESAQAAGAVNTVKRIDSLFVGYNTDGDGLVRSLAVDCSFNPTGKTIVVYGAGGAARGAVAALCRAGARSIHIVNRTESTAQEVVSSLSCLYSGTDLAVAHSQNTITDVLAGADLLVNTTSLGMKYETLPGVDFDVMKRTAVVYDMIYSPFRTPLLQVAEERCMPCANGLGMLASQGELAFEIWTGVMPECGLMRTALDVLVNVNNA